MYDLDDPDPIEEAEAWLKKNEHVENYAQQSEIGDAYWIMKLLLEELQ